MQQHVTEKCLVSAVRKLTVFHVFRLVMWSYKTTWTYWSVSIGVLFELSPGVKAWEETVKSLIVPSIEYDQSNGACRGELAFVR